MDTRERIVETASRLFYKQGYNQTGINQVIREADVAKASLYQYFPSKEDLLIEYLKRAADGTNQMLRAAQEKQRTPKEKVISLFDFLMKQTKQDDYTGCHFLNIASEIPKPDDKIRALVRKEKNYIRNLFSEILKPSGKDHLADELYLLFDAALISSRVYGDVWPVKTAKKIAQKLL